MHTISVGDIVQYNRDYLNDLAPLAAQAKSGWTGTVIKTGLGTAGELCAVQFGELTVNAYISDLDVVRA